MPRNTIHDEIKQTTTLQNTAVAGGPIMVRYSDNGISNTVVGHEGNVISKSVSKNMPGE